MAKTKTKRGGRTRPARGGQGGKLAGRFSSQVAAEQTLRFNPERSALLAAADEAVSNFKSTRKSNRAQAEAVTRSAEEARPKVERTYGEASAAAAAARADMEEDVAPLGPTADRFKAAIAREGSGAAGRLAEELASVTADLDQAKVRAEEGRVHGNQAARRELRGTIGSLQQRLQQLGVEEGAFAQGRTGELVGDQRDRDVTLRGQSLTARTSRRNSRDATRRTKISAREASRRARQSQRAQDRRAAQSNAQSERNSIRSAGLDPSTGKPIPGGKLDPDGDGKRGGFEKATATQRASARDAISLAMSQAKPLKAGGASRGVVGPALVQGQSATSTTDPATGEKTQVPGIDKVPSLYASIALDMLYDGHVSARNVAELRRRGLTPKSLGLPAGQVRRTTSATGAAPAAPGGRLGGQRPT